MARKHVLLGITAGTGLVAALTAPALASQTRSPVQHPQAAPFAPDPAVMHAARLQKQMRTTLGGTFGGAWVTDGANLVVATTDASAVATIKKAGARPKVVRYAERTLDAVQTKLNQHSASAPKPVTSWYVDVQRNTVVIKASSAAAAKRFATASGVDAGTVTIVRSTARPRPLHDLVGGERYWTSKYGCSIAFSVTGGFISAGHCGGVGEKTRGSNQVDQGTFKGSSFPGDDYAWIDTNAQWTPTPKLTRWDGSYETVQGATEAPIGAAVCRSGGTTNTKLWCGKIQERNASVKYEQGTVSGLIRTDICADPGDSGGALITQTGGQAQGITSGGSGSCKDGQGEGDEVFFQPVDEVLQLIARDGGRKLVTANGHRSDADGACDGNQTKASGNVTSGSSAHEPDGGFTTTASGPLSACLDAFDGVDFDLYLEKKDGSTWTTVAGSTDPEPNETLTFEGAPGTYRWRVHAYDGSGAFTLRYGTA
ncbi:S1 family peptidase [Actinomadura graeca]|uniref:S1 family peptidase n=1 Tax=Actinomadura graeca TaxID=2750812 RepID=A0ABX8R3U2_9ACTN|nr:S1 family peptidase [Actinomadura graeca]QXJ25709.1 S1 family peptidase [Actinomadura graeca]